MSEGGFGGVYGAPSTINNYVEGRRRLGEEHHRYLMSTNFTYYRALQDLTIESLPNPVYCIKEGEGFLFQITDSYHYPVYLRDSVINSNELFDYGAFLILEGEMKNKQADGNTAASLFTFTFN